MTDAYTFRLVRTSYKSRDLVIESAGRTLVVYLEMSGISDFDWVGRYSDLSNWKSPSREPLTPEERADVLKRLVDWSRKENLTVALEERAVSDEWINEHRKLGFTTRASGERLVVISTPRRLGFIARMLKNMFPSHERAA